MNMITTDMKRTMTSIEIADIAGKRHDHVMRDVKDLIDRGAISLPNFGESTYKNNRGKEYPMYDLDFKATMVLITGYDHKRRSIVVDRWIALETGQAQPAFKQKPRTLLKTAQDFRALKSMATISGLQGNQAVLSANQAMVKIHDENPLELIGATHLISESQERYLTPTEIKNMVELKSAQAVNKALKTAGLQEKDGKHWTPTDAGNEYAVLMDTGKKRGDGTMVQQIKWKESVVQVISKAATA